MVMVCLPEMATSELGDDPLASRVVVHWGMTASGLRLGPIRVICVYPNLHCSISVLLSRTRCLSGRLTLTCITFWLCDLSSSCETAGWEHLTRVVTRVRARPLAQHT